MIDCFMVESPATSVAMAPNSVYLATTHADELGIYLWYDCNGSERCPDLGPIEYLYVYIYNWECLGSMDKCPES